MILVSRSSPGYFELLALNQVGGRIHVLLQVEANVKHEFVRPALCANVMRLLF